MPEVHPLWYVAGALALGFGVWYLVRDEKPAQAAAPAPPPPGPAIPPLTSYVPVP